MNINPRNPKVSIGFPVFNGAGKMRPAIDSILGQSFRDFELIISDNASTDDTAAVCEEYALRDSRVRYIRQKTNIGQIPNMYFVAKAARGEYFMWAHDDDTRGPSTLERFVSVLDSNPDYGIVMSSYQNIYETGRIQKTVLFKGPWDLTRDSYYSVYRKIIYKKPIHHFLHGMFRRDLFSKFIRRPIPRSTRWDRAFMTEVALATHFYSVPEVLFFKRVTDVPIAIRYKGDMAGDAFGKLFPRATFFWSVIWRVISSKVVPFYRKVVAFGIWLRCIFHYRRAFLEDTKEYFILRRS